MTLDKICACIIMGKPILDEGLLSTRKHGSVKYFKLNKISFIYLNELNHSLINKLKVEECFKSALLDEKVLKTNWEKDFNIIKKVWDTNDIKYMFHKSVGEFAFAK